MITGFNTDIKYRGQVFHIQTEDKGLSNPVIESLVYKGGEILATRRQSYKELAENSFSEQELTKLMEEQHKRVILEIQAGKMEFGKEGNLLESPEERALDDLVIEYLGGASVLEKIKIKLPERLEVLPGTPSEFVVSTRKSITLEPVPGAKVAVNLVASGKALPLFSGVSDKFGKITARFVVPDTVGDEAVLIISASSDAGHDETRHLIRRSSR